MITADFYPTQTTHFNTEYTNTIPNLDYSDPEKIAAPYYMGYINYDDIPPALKASYCKFVYNDAEAYVEFTDITNAENVPWFFTGYYSTSGNATAHCYYRLNHNTNKYLTNSDLSGMGHWGFLNSLEIERVSYRENFSLTFTIQFLDTSTTPPVYSADTYVDSDGKTFSSYSEIEDFLSNTTPLTFTYTKYGETYTAEIYARDIESGYCEITTPGGYLWKFYLTDFTNFISERDMQPNGNVANYSNIGVGTLMHYNHPTKGITPLINNLFSWHFPPAEERYINIVFNATTQNAYSGRWIDSWTALGGFQCKIPYAYFLNASNYQVARFGNSIIVKLGIDINHLKRVFSLGEVLRTYVYMFTRLSTTATTSYGFNDDMKIPLFKDDNSPLWDYVSGELEDIQSKLQPWQYTNITTNTFTEDDIPAYNPIPGGGDDDSGGDDIRPSDWTNLRIGAANNFVTLYGMTAETVSDFGRKMWAQLADPEFWQMVGTAFTNDFSINPADMMRYFVSLRYFPFDVSDFAHTTSSGVYIGRAATPIAPSVGVAYPLRLTNSTVQVSGGTLTIPRQYNDFRDYEPCTTVQVHIPFCGSVEVPASEVMGHTMDLTYKIDLQTGAMLGVLCVSSNTYYVIATVAGTVGASIPITANNNIEFLQRIATIGSGLVGGGVSGALKGAMLGGEVGAVVGAVAGTVGGGVGALAGLPPVTVHKQGNASGFANLGGVPYAYATVQRSRFELPDNYGHTTGFACDFAATISGLNGYTVCDNVDTSGLSCNSRERDEIKRLLESGVYV